MLSTTVFEDKKKRQLYFAYKSPHVELLDGDMVNDHGWFVALVECIGKHGLCFLNELFRKVGPLESEGHG